MAMGMSTKEEDIVAIQDILAGSTIDELDTLANDLSDQVGDLKCQIAEKDYEIVMLKAKLYDMMVKD